MYKCSFFFYALVNTLSFLIKADLTDWRDISWWFIFSSLDNGYLYVYLLLICMSSFEMYLFMEMDYYCLHSLKFIFIYLKKWKEREGWGRNRERERSFNFLFSGSFPNGLNSQNGAKLKPGAWNSTGVSDMVDMADTWATFYCFPRHLKGNWMKSRASRTQTRSLIGDIAVKSHGLTCCATIPAPVISILELRECFSVCTLHCGAMMGYLHSNLPKS